VCCSVLQSLKCNKEDEVAAIYVSVAACCSVLQCNAVCYRVLKSLPFNLKDEAAAVYVSVAACCNVLQSVLLCCSPLSATFKIRLLLFM